MSILGVVTRCQPSALPPVTARLAALAGVTLTHNPGDGRLVLVIEDQPGLSAAARLGELSQWPEMLATSLVYEYSGADSPAPDAHARADWRQDLQQLDTPASTGSRSQD